MINNPQFCAVLTSDEILDLPQELSQAIAMLRANGLTIKPPNDSFPTPPPIQFWESAKIEQYRSLGPIIYS